MNAEQKARFIHTVRELRDAFVKAELESGIDGEGDIINQSPAIEAYPFAHSFNEMPGYVEAWIEALEKTPTN